MNINAGVLYKDGEDRLYLVGHVQPKGVIIVYRLDLETFALMRDENEVPKTKVFRTMEAYHEWLSGCTMVGYRD